MDNTGESRLGVGGPLGDNRQRYEVRENLMSFGDDYWVETTTGRHSFLVDGKTGHMRDTLVFRDPRGIELCIIEGRGPGTNAMRIRLPGQEAVTISAGRVSVPGDGLSGDVFIARTASHDAIDIRGNIASYEYIMQRSSRTVAEVSKRWIDQADTYVVEIEPGQEDILILAIAVAVDYLTRRIDD